MCQASNLSQVAPTKIVDSPPMMNGDNTKKRRRRRKNSEGSISSSGSNSCSKTATSSPSRRRRRKRGGAKQKVAAVVEELTPEEASHYIAMDCEMVGVGSYGHKSVVARITMVDWYGNVVYDEFVTPTEAVTDFRTFVSGITPEDLEQSIDIATCREHVLELLEGKILIGHALKNDLHALGIAHPWQQTRDTAKYEPFMKVRFDDGILWPRKLKELVKEKLNQDIQEAGKAHSAYEDSVAALQLYKQVRRKWEKAMDYKINKTREILQQQQLAQ